MSIPSAYIGVILIWATTPLTIKWSSEGVGFLFGVATRMGIGLVICLALVWMLRIELPRDRVAMQTYLAAGLGIFAAMLLTYWGAQYIDSGVISVLFGFTPVMTGVMATLWLGERIFTVPRMLGMLLGIAGLATIFNAPAEASGASLSGITAVLVAVVIHSSSSVWVKRIGADISAMAINSGALLIAVPLFFVAWLVGDGVLPEAVPEQAAMGIIYLGVFGTVLGFNLFYYVLKHISAGAISLITLITPVLALFLGIQFNGEVIAMQVWIGTALILSGLLSYQFGERLIRGLSGRGAEKLMQPEEIE